MCFFKGAIQIKLYYYKTDTVRANSPEKHQSLYLLPGSAHSSYCTLTAPIQIFVYCMLKFKAAQYFSTYNVKGVTYKDKPIKSCNPWSSQLYGAVFCLVLVLQPTTLLFWLTHQPCLQKQQAAVYRLMTKPLYSTCPAPHSRKNQ